MPKRKKVPYIFLPEGKTRAQRSESPVSWWVNVDREQWQETVAEQALRLSLSPMGQRGGNKES